MRQMLCDLERHGEVEAASESQRFVEPVRNEPLRREMQLLGRHPIAVDADVVLDAVAREGLQPDPVTAAEIHDAARRDTFHHERYDGLG